MTALDRTAREPRDTDAEYAHRLQCALTGLSGGGSENFVSHKDSFRADIPFCVSRINAKIDGHYRRWGAEARAHKATRADLAAALARAEAAEAKVREAWEAGRDAGIEVCEAWNECNQSSSFAHDAVLECASSIRRLQPPAEYAGEPPR